MGRKILFITTDQQRYDALGCNGGKIARTPVVDALAKHGINYSRAHNQNVVCMPARSTMMTGQHVRSHGVIANGIPLPADAPASRRIFMTRRGIARRCWARRISSRCSTWGATTSKPDGARRFRPTVSRLRADGTPMHGLMGNWHYPLWFSAKLSRRDRRIRRDARCERRRRDRRARAEITIRFRASTITPTGWRIAPIAFL